MTTQIDIFGNDQDWTMPALLVVLMTILAMLGIVANVAAGLSRRSHHSHAQSAPAGTMSRTGASVLPRSDRGDVPGQLPRKSPPSGPGCRPPSGSSVRRPSGAIQAV